MSSCAYAQEFFLNEQDFTYASSLYEVFLDFPKQLLDHEHSSHLTSTVLHNIIQNSVLSG